MSIYTISIVPKQLVYHGDRFAKSKEIVQWLIDENVIDSAVRADSAWGEYQYRSGILKYCQPSPWCHPNRGGYGMSVITEKTVFDRLGFDKATCSHCGFSMNEYVFYKIVGSWWENAGEVPCPGCAKGLSIMDVIVEPAWGFSDLGFTFWEAPDFTQEFYAKFEKRLESKLWIVYCRL